MPTNMNTKYALFWCSKKSRRTIRRVSSYIMNVKMSI